MPAFRTTSLTLLLSSMLGASAVLCATAFADDGPATPTTAPSTQPAGVEKIDIETFESLRADATQVVLDVRTPGEYAQGHVPGAINVPMGKTFDEAIASYDKSKPYLVYCHSGKRSFLATKRMQELGFEHLRNFRGGIAAWEDANKPMVKGTKPNEGEEPATR